MKANTLRLRCLADLKLVQVQMREHAQREAALEAARALEAKRQAAQRNLFQMAAGAVTRLRHQPNADLRPARPEPTPMQHMLDEAAALREALSDEVDVTSLLDTDEHLSFRRPGVGVDVAERLRRGEWTIQRQVDLHGLRTDEARETLGQFIRESHKQGIRCVRVVHGKGLGSPSKTPVLKDKVHRWLVQKTEVVAFVQAPRAHGGAGALVVLLQPLRQRPRIR